jgi:putative two-component system response regulator
MDKKTILVVDDAAENIDLLVGLLKERYTVKAARNGVVALKIAQSPKKPDLVLLDIVMPEMDGFTVCSELKSNPDTAMIPVIFISGEIGVEERQRGTELGAVEYLTKPVEPNKLMMAIETAFAD